VGFEVGSWEVGAWGEGFGMDSPHAMEDVAQVRGALPGSGFRV
jgi:hypothetical protein